LADYKCFYGDGVTDAELFLCCCVEGGGEEKPAGELEDVEGEKS